MFNRIIVPYDGLKNTVNSVRYAIQLSKVFGSKIYLVYIIDEDSFNSTKNAKGLNDTLTRKYCILRTKRVFDSAREELRKGNIKNFELRIEFSKSVHSGIKRFIEKNRCDLCILEESPYARSELVGNLAERILREISIPTIILRTFSNLPKHPKILFTVDEKERDFYEIIHSIKKLNPKVILYHTTWRKKDLEDNDPLRHCENGVKTNLDKILKWTKSDSESIIEMEPTIEGGIIKCSVRMGVDLIVMHQSKSIIGGKPDLVLTHSMYPILVLP